MLSAVAEHLHQKIGSTLITFGCSVNAGSELTIPSTFTVRFNLLRSPSSAFIAESRLMAANGIAPATVELGKEALPTLSR